MKQNMDLLEQKKLQGRLLKNQCGANQWTGFYMITASLMKGINKKQRGKEFERSVLVVS